MQSAVIQAFRKKSPETAKRYLFVGGVLELDTSHDGNIVTSGGSQHTCDTPICFPPFKVEDSLSIEELLRPHRRRFRHLDSRGMKEV